jgi:hypothetical protein
MRALDHFTLCGTNLSVLQYEGTVQLCFWDETLPQGKPGMAYTDLCRAIINDAYYEDVGKAAE